MIHNPRIAQVALGQQVWILTEASARRLVVGPMPGRDGAPSIGSVRAVDADTTADLPPYGRWATPVDVALWESMRLPAPNQTTKTGVQT